MLNNLYFSEHHLSHCSSAFFPSPFSNAGILTLDGIGEWATTTIAKGENNHIEILQELHFPHSLGLLYSAFTYYLGFKVNSGEYKVMGLAPYGEPKFVDIIKTHLIDIKPDGSFSLNMKYFSYTYGLKMTNAKFDSLFHAQRSPESKLEQIHMDIAASLQVVTEEIMIALARTTARLSGSRNLVLSGGVALNCVGNGKIYQQLIKEEKLLDHIWIQPASGDAGSAVGCGLAFYHIECKQPRFRDSALGSHSGDFVDFRTTADHKSSSALKSTKSTTSPTANLRIREEENQAGRENATALESIFSHNAANIMDRYAAHAASKKVDSSVQVGYPSLPDTAQAVAWQSISAQVDSSTATTLNESAQDSRICENAKNLSESQAEAVEMRNRGFQAIDKGATLAVVTADNRADSRKSAAKPTPKINPSNSKILELESGLSNATNIKGSQAAGKVDSSTATTLNESAQDSRICENAKNLTTPQAEAVEMRNRGFQAIGKGATLAVVTADNRAESAIYRSNATPLLKDSMQGSYLGLSYSNAEVQATLDSLNAIYEKHSFDTIKHLTAKALTQGKVVGWHQGRCEFGPRALGARSILGDPRNTTMQKTMNLKIKYRESFRPFAPSVLDFAINEWFECDYISPYMLLVAPVKREKCYPLTQEQKELFGIDKLNIVRSEIPSVTHIDYSARIQSVHKETNPRYYALIEEFYKLSGVPVLVNTSFNVRGEPMVCSPYDSYACFMGTEMDMLVIEDFILYKEKQPKEHIAKFRDIKDKYELD